MTVSIPKGKYGRSKNHCSQQEHSNMKSTKYTIKYSEFILPPTTSYLLQGTSLLGTISTQTLLKCT
jgi:hypothetical protein